MFGFVVLLIMFLMVVISYDFWNVNFGLGLWKVFYMGVYFVYGLFVVYIVLGVI